MPLAIAPSAKAPAQARKPARRRLLDAALSRFATEGPRAPTLEEIRAEAGVSVGALYHHFADRRALATALYVEILDGYQAGFRERLLEQPGAREGVVATVAFHVLWCAEQPDRARFLIQRRAEADAEAIAAASRPFLREALAWYSGHLHYGAVRELPFDLVHALWLGPAQEWSRHWLAGRAEGSPKEAAGELAAGAWRALRADGSDSTTTEPRGGTDE